MDFDQARVLNESIRAIGIRHRALADALLSPLGLHTGQEVLLLDLAEHGPRTQRQLASASGCEPPTITNSVHKLEAAGLVARRPSPTDQRATIVELTNRGHELLPELKAVWQLLAEESVAGLTSVPLDEVASAVIDLATSLNATNPSLRKLTAANAE